MGKINLSPVDGRRDEAFRVDERKQSRLPATFVRRLLVRSLSLPRRVRIQMKDDLDSQPFRRRPRRRQFSKLHVATPARKFAAACSKSRF